MPAVLSREDYQSLKRAYEYLETPSLAMRLSNAVGTPIEMGLKLLPRAWYVNLHRRAEHAIWKALNRVAESLRYKRGKSSDFCYRLVGVAGGALGGFFGGPALLLELPFTTTVMLRAIADIARSEGEDLDDIHARLACLEVFALGGRSQEDDAADLGYYGIRLALEAPVASASRYIAEGGLVNRTGAPMLVDFIVTVAQRFGVTLSEKAAAEIVPVIGAFGGALVNSVFIQHFQDMARSHFTMRRLERKYSPALIRAEYERLAIADSRLLCATA